MECDGEEVCGGYRIVYSHRSDRRQDRERKPRKNNEATAAIKGLVNGMDEMREIQILLQDA